MKMNKAHLLLIAILLVFAVVHAPLANDSVEGRPLNVSTTRAVKININ